MKPEKNKTREIMTRFHKKVINAFIAKNKKKFDKTTIIDEAFHNLKETLTQRIDLYFTPNTSRQYQVTPENFFSNTQTFVHLNDDLLDYENLIGNKLQKKIFVSIQL